MSENVELLSRIIPHIKMEFSVYNTAYNKLKRSYYCTAGKAFQKHTFRFHFEIRNVYHQKCGATCKAHCPVSKASEHNFNKTVKNCAYGKNYKKFSVLFQKNHRGYFSLGDCFYYSFFE